MSLMAARHDREVDPTPPQQFAQDRAPRLPAARQCAEAYIRAHEIGWKNQKDRAQWSSTLAS
jgi:hypothetical protein